MSISVGVTSIDRVMRDVAVKASRCPWCSESGGDDCARFFTCSDCGSSVPWCQGCTYGDERDGMCPYCAQDFEATE